MDLDDEELKATRMMNGADRNGRANKMEQDIKNLQEIINSCNEEFDNKDENVTAVLDLTDLLSLRNLIKAYKELEEKYNNELDENLKMSEWLVEKQHRIEELEENKELNFYKEWYEVYKKEISKRNIKARQVLAKLKRIKEADIVNLHEINILDEIEKELENYIPVSLVEEKIEKLNEYYKKEIYPSLMNWSDVDITEYYDGMIEVLQELLEKRK